MIEILNLRRDYPTEPYDFRVDRRSPIGNPHPLTHECDRDKVIALYKVPVNHSYFREIVAAYQTHGRLRLFCWCAPKHCHAELIRDAVIERCECDV